MDDNQKQQESVEQNILQPTFHFKTQEIKIGEDYTTETTPVTEFVAAGQLLADFPDFEKFAAKGFYKAALEQGAFVHLSDDEEAILASVPGYPKLRKIRRPESSGLINMISVEPLFLISQDKMKVTINIHPCPDDCSSLQDLNLEKLLKKEGIFYGLDSKALKTAIECIAGGEKEFSKFVIARGQMVGESEDAYLRYEIEIGPIAGTILEDGKIDFRDRRIMVGVKSGECIATKIPAVQGEPGINVYGEKTAAPEGKDLKVEILNDAQFSPETMEITAAKDGVLSIVNNNVIRVCSHQVISGDVDYETGNVDSMSAITVQGSVQPGFKVTAEGDIKIVGSVMSATVQCAGNLVVNGGITGQDSNLQAKGDVDIKFIEMGTLQCGGMAVVRKQSYYSKISADSDIVCHQAGKVIGGHLIAGGNLSLGDVGSKDSTPSLIAAGVVAERLVHLQQLKSSVVELQDAIIQWLQLYPGSSKSKKIKKMEKELAETKLQLLRTNLIPGTGIVSRAAGPADKATDMDEDYSSAGGISIEKTRIGVQGTIFAGTEIRIGNRAMKLVKTVSNRQFKLHPNGKSIIAGPVKRQNHKFP